MNALYYVWFDSLLQELFVHSCETVVPAVKQKLGNEGIALHVVEAETRQLAKEKFLHMSATGKQYCTLQ